ncbi:MAG: T9SS type A sorting domain-containing protein [Ignavibacteriales bacterium]|jgi:hypothetical protein|nr:T9SS type A sorting domain-containing protein [Ignavibacteriaceae bacterium]NLH60310.1 T9SS type A sorting domain-containing protein [Ignavibacteriales bacterium]
MKKIILFPLLVLLVLPFYIYGQAEFETGKIGVILNSYGRIRVFAPTNATRQIDRSSILVAKNQTEVFDYYNDGETEDTANIIQVPFADFAVYGSTNNTYNDPPFPPAVTSKVWVYGWIEKQFLIVKSTVVNNETAPFPAIVGMELIPQLAGEYGNEVVACDVAANLVFSYKPNDYIGYKLLGANLYSSIGIDWYDGYAVDTSYWTWLNTPPSAFNLQTGGDGAVAMFAKSPVTLQPGGSTDTYIAIAYGVTEAQMRANLDTAVIQYNTLVSVEENPSVIPEHFSLMQNYPNPFNPATTISFTVPHSDFITLKVYDILGNEVATLVNESLAPGTHNVSFNALNLSTGTYLYKLSNSNSTLTNKMLLIK